MYIDKANAILKAMFATTGVTLVNVKWSKDGLNDVLTQDAYKITYGAFRKVDGDTNTGTVKGVELNTSPTFQGFDQQGEVYSVSYLSSTYSGNKIGINGERSLVRGEMDENSTINYVKSVLLQHSDF